MLAAMLTTNSRLGLTADELMTKAIGWSLVVAAGFLPWLAVRDGTGVKNGIALADLGLSRWIYCVLVLLVLVGTLGELFEFAPELCRLGSSALALCLLVIPFMTLAVTEVVALMAYPDFLPRTMRRYLPGSQPQLGLWLAVTGAVVLLLSMTDSSHGFVIRLRAFGNGLLHLRALSLGNLLLVGGITLLVIARGASWVSASTPAGAWNVPGYIIPWVGTGTLIILAVVVVVTCAVLVGPRTELGGSLVVVGWLLTLTAAVFVVPAASAPRVTPPGWIVDGLDNWIGRLDRLPGVSRIVSIPHPGTSLSLSLPQGPIMAFAAGLMIAIAGILISGAAARSKST